VQRVDSYFLVEFNRYR